jgi:hypothetical protein
LLCKAANQFILWCEHGTAIIQKVREARPEVYMKIIASMLPYKVEAEFPGRPMMIGSRNAARGGCL